MELYVIQGGLEETFQYKVTEKVKSAYASIKKWSESTLETNEAAAAWAFGAMTYLIYVTLTLATWSWFWCFGLVCCYYLLFKFMTWIMG